jgi:hypothetical protein
MTRTKIKHEFDLWVWVSGPVPGWEQYTRRPFLTEENAVLWAKKYLKNVRVVGWPRGFGDPSGAVKGTLI